MSESYFIGDPHLRHRNICKYRDFSSNEEHDGLVEENILSVSNKRNTLWLLGDVFFSDDCYNFATEVCDKFAHVKVLLGNHCTENNQRWGLLRRLIIENDNFTVHGMLSKYGYWITHAPLHDSELRGKVLNVHGHTHSVSVDDHRYLCVSAEQIDYKPISLMTIRGIVEERGLNKKN